MASVLKHQRPAGRRYRVQWYTEKGTKRHAIWLGAEATHKEAANIAGRVERILQSKRLGQSLDRDTEIWLHEIDDGLAAKLAKEGLIEPRQSTTLSAFLEGFITGQGDKAPATIIKYKRVRKWLVNYFGELRLLHTITRGNADEWQQWLAKQYAEASVNIGTSTAKVFFGHAERCGLVRVNPFKHLRKGDDCNPEREAFIERGTIDRVIDAAPDADWRLIIALARFAGLRIPSELRGLRWSDVNLARRVMTIHSPKTKRSGKKLRHVPIFAELLPYLEDAAELAADACGDQHVVKRWNQAAPYLRRQFEKILQRAGVDQWERLFQNLRSSRETELVDEFPDHVVAKWLGNTPKVARRHYLQVTDAHFAKAIGGSVGGARATQSAVEAGNARQPQEAAAGDADISGVCRVSPAAATDQYPRQGSNL